jgi:hypothetical protein
MDYEYNRLYFEPETPKDHMAAMGAFIASFCMLMIGIFMGIMSDIESGGVMITVIFTVLGLGFIALGVYFIKGTIEYNKNIVIVGDDDIDKVYKNNLKNLKLMAINKLGIDEDQVKEYNPISFRWYDYEPLMKIKPQYKMGVDGKLRSSHCKGSIYLFSAEQIYYYEYRFSLLENKKQEMTDEYFYSDIVSVSTKSDIITYGDENTAFGAATQSVNVETFTLTTSAGTSVGAALENIENAQSSINTLKNLLREKKQQLK